MAARRKQANPEAETTAAAQVTAGLYGQHIVGERRLDIALGPQFDATLPEHRPACASPSSRGGRS